MTGICFFFENEDVDVWSGKDLDAWNYACKVAGDITDVIVINKTSQTLLPMDAAMNFTVVSTLEEAQALMSGEIVYMACPWDNTILSSLTGYAHTANWYVLGPAAGWGSYSIPSGMYVPQAGLAAVHSVHLATVLMFHRFWALNV